MELKSVFELHDLAMSQAANYPHARTLLNELREEGGEHFTGVVGPRGVGKTVLLKQMAANDPEAMYLALDTLDRNEDVFELIKKLSREYGYRRFFLDEVHFQPQIDEVLKKTYDFLDVRITFTSSVALALKQSAYDLSRRTVLRPLNPFSFREYLFFKHGVRLDPLTLEQVFNKEWTPGHLRAGLHFGDYLRGGLMPFALNEPEPLEILKNILRTIIHKDIPAIARLLVDELETIAKLVEFTGRSGVDGINYTSLSKNLGITKYKAEQYLGLLEQAFVLQRIFPKGTNVLKEPKVLMAVPYRLLYRDIEDSIGGLREDFLAEMLRHANIPVHYLKTKRGAKTPDYLLRDGTIVEVGGKGKGFSQFKGVEADRKYVFTHSDQFDGTRRPLFMLGYLC
ncbi:MAG: AAA family ATPase [Verrucomicrobiota bacterium]